MFESHDEYNASTHDSSGHIEDAVSRVKDIFLEDPRRPKLIVPKQKAGQAGYKAIGPSKRIKAPDSFEEIDGEELNRFASEVAKSLVQSCVDAQANVTKSRYYRIDFYEFDEDGKETSYAHHTFKLEPEHLPAQGTELATLNGTAQVIATQNKLIESQHVRQDDQLSRAAGFGDDQTRECRPAEQG